MPSPSNFYFILIDTIGLAIFNVVGIEKALISGTGMIVALTMGMTTGIFGGLMRDVVCREVPYVMRGDVYASACFAGGLTYAAFFCPRHPLHLVHFRFYLCNSFNENCIVALGG
jgi:uncharacterized membrane protein YeiH